MLAENRPFEKNNTFIYFLQVLRRRSGREERRDGDDLEHCGGVRVGCRSKIFLRIKPQYAFFFFV